jgi:hypothetical protein
VALFPSSELWKDAPASGRYTVVIRFLVTYTNTSHGVPVSHTSLQTNPQHAKPLKYIRASYPTTQIPHRDAGGVFCCPL